MKSRALLKKCWKSIATRKKNNFSTGTQLSGATHTAVVDAIPMHMHRALSGFNDLLLRAYQGKAMGEGTNLQRID